MTKKYIAVGSVGHFLPGDEIKGLDADRIQALLASGAITEEIPVAEEQTKPDPKITELEKQVAGLEAEKEKISAEKIELEKQVAGLQAKIVALEKVTSTAAEDKSKTAAKEEKAK